MDSQPIAEALPELYRRVLDRIADLEGAGFRREADLVRRSATSAYARRWNERTTRQLERLVDRAVRVLDGRERARSRRAGRDRALAAWLPWRAATRRRIVATVRARTRPAPARAALSPEQPAA